MLPSSHHSPIISPLAGRGKEHGSNGLDLQWIDELSRQPETTAHTSTNALALAEAFAEFVTTSSRLENSYRTLQDEVAGLRAELAERNAALKASLSDNQRVRLELQQVVDSMPCGVLVAGPDGNISTINPETGRMLGLDPGAPLPKTLREMEAQSGLGLKLASVGRSGSEWEQEFCLKTTGGERWLHVRTRAMRKAGSGSRPELTILVLRDITAQRRAERDREAARNATVLAQITTMLAHEIRNPLASLELFAGLIETDDAQRPEWISNLRAGIRSLSGTVNNVLSLHDTGSLKLSAIALTQVVSDTVRFAMPLADQAGITLRWKNHARSQEDTRVLGNSGALQQVVLNLIRNAIRHTPAGGFVEITLGRTGNAVTLACNDTGSGIRPDQLEHLFEAGFSGSGDTPGLGLAVCDRILKQHNANISASNLPGSGACFLIAFPILQQEAA